MKNFILYFLFIPFPLFAQDKFFEEAWIQFPNGSIRSGQINRIRESALCKEIAFRADADSDVQVFLPAALAGFGFVKDSLRFETVEYAYNVAGATFKNPRFAKLMLKGRTSLFKLQIPEEESKVVFEKAKDFVYILRKDGKDYTLRQKESLEGSQYLLKKEYQNALRYLTDDCPAMRARTGKVEFSDREISAFVLDYNHCNDPQAASVQFSHRTKNKIWQGLEAGGVRLFVPENPGGYGAFAGVFRETLKPDLNERISLVTGVNYQYLNEKISGKTQIYHALRVHLLINARLTQGRTVPFVNLGFSGEIASVGGVGAYFSTGAGLWAGRYRVMALIDHSRLNPGGPKIISLGLGYNFRKTQ